MVTFQEETWEQFIQDALPLLEANNLERNLFGEHLDINEKVYQQCAKTDWLKIYTIRDESELVGYCAYFLFMHSHHKTSLHAKQDVLYIKQGKRGKCLPFISFCDSQLKEEGVDFIHQSVPHDNDWSPILKRLGYKKLETNYIRGL